MNKVQYSVTYVCRNLCDNGTYKEGMGGFSSLESAEKFIKANAEFCKKNENTRIESYVISKTTTEEVASGTFNE